MFGIVSLPWGLVAVLHGVLPACTVIIGTEQVGSMLQWPILDWKNSAQVGSSSQACAAGVLQWMSRAAACVVAWRFSGEALVGSMVRMEAWAMSYHCERDLSCLTMACQLSAWIVVSIAGATPAPPPKSTGRSWTF